MNMVKPALVGMGGYFLGALLTVVVVGPLVTRAQLSGDRDLALVAVTILAACFAGGVVAARISPPHWGTGMRVAAATSGLVVVGAFSALFVGEIEHRVWMQLANLVLPASAGAAGAALGAPRLA